MFSEEEHIDQSTEEADPEFVLESGKVTAAVFIHSLLF